MLKWVLKFKKTLCSKKAIFGNSVLVISKMVIV